MIALDTLEHGLVRRLDFTILSVVLARNAMCLAAHFVVCLLSELCCGLYGLIDLTLEHPALVLDFLVVDAHPVDVIELVHRLVVLAVPWPVGVHLDDLRRRLFHANGQVFRGQVGFDGHEVGRTSGGLGVGSVHSDFLL